MRRILRKVLFSGVLTVFLFTLTACWDSIDINRREIILMVYVDYEDGEYTLAGEFASVNNKFGGAEESSAGVVYYEAKGKSLNAARDELNRQSEYPVYAAANSTVIFGPGISKKSFEEYISRLTSEVEYRQRVNIVTTDTPLKDLLEIKPRNQQSLGFAIQEILYTIRNHKEGIYSDVGHTIEHLAGKHDSFLLPQFDKVEKTIALSGYSVHKNGKKVDVIKAEDRKGIIMILGERPILHYEINDGDQSYLLKTTCTHKETDVQYEGGQLTVTFRVKAQAEIMYLEDIEKTISGEGILRANEKLTKRMEEDILNTYRKAQKEYGADYLHLYHAFIAKYPQEYRRIDHWDEVFSQAEIRAEVEVKEVEPPPPIYN